MSLIRLLTTGYLGIYLAGCAVSEQFTVSMPETVPVGVTGAVIKDVLQIELAGLKLSVQVQNYRDTGRGLGPDPDPPFNPVSQKRWTPDGPLRIWLGLVPSEEGFSFDPGRVLIKYSDGTSVRASAFIGPADIWASVRDVSMGCGARRYSMGVALSRMEPQKEGIKVPQGPIPFSDKRCFVLWFDTDAFPGRNFALLIEGIEKSGKPIPIHEIRYQRGSVLKYFVVP